MSNFINSVQCSKGHWYDPSVTSYCPQCAAEAKEAGFTFDETGKTEAAPPVDDFEETEAVERGNPTYYGPQSAGGTTSWEKETEPVSETFRAEEFGTGSPFHVDSYDATVPAYMNNTPGFTPVTGWLVCIDGPSKGADYRIHTDYNFIGRDPSMDICIKGDNRIGRDRHAVLVYDSQERLFFFGPQNAKSVVRVNNRPVIGQAELKSHDIITIGSTKLMFVPLCGEDFNWDR